MAINKETLIAIHCMFTTLLVYGQERQNVHNDYVPDHQINKYEQPFSNPNPNQTSNIKFNYLLPELRHASLYLLCSGFETIYNRNKIQLLASQIRY